MKYSAACDIQFGAYYYGYGTCAVVLPVELVSFTAKESDNKIILNWTTLSEVNNHHFELESSGNGIDFVPIGEREQPGCSGQQQSGIKLYF